jgi:RNA polymerase primary sigma factor
VVSNNYGYEDVVAQFLKESINPLSVTQEKQLARIIWHRLSGWQEARDKFYHANLRLVAHVVLQSFWPKANLEDLNDMLVEGALGLLRAIETFDYRRSQRFSTFAAPWIKQAVWREIEKERSIHLPSYIIDQLHAYMKKRQSFIVQFGREPTTVEWADWCGVDEWELVLFLEKTRDCQSLEDVYPIRDDGGGIGWSEALVDDAVDLERVATINNLRDLLNGCLNHLEPREAAVIEMRYGLSDGTAKTLQAVAGVLGLSRERVRQIESRALHKMRQMLPVELAEGLGKV